MIDEQSGELKHEGIELAEDIIEENKHWQDVRERAALLLCKDYYLAQKQLVLLRILLKQQLTTQIHLLKNLKRNNHGSN